MTGRPRHRPPGTGTTGRLRAVLFVLCLALTAAGCGLAVPGGDDGRPKVTILGPWTGEQEKQFKGVLDTLGTPYTYQGTAATREVLLAGVQAGDPPDIAILPGIGDLVEYAAENRLKPVGRPAGAPAYGRPWQPEAEGMDADLWVPLKADLKSIVWYRTDRPPPSAPAPLGSWCIGMGDDGASGWPGSDWIEDLILQTAGPVLYGRWATGDLSWTAEPVVRAWRLWAGLLAQDPGTARDALKEDHRGVPGGNGLLFQGDCALEHQGSFARSFYGDHRDRASFTDSARLLPGGPRAKGREVSADFAALFGDSAQARDLLARLTSRRAQEEWGRRAGVFSPNPDVPARSGTVEKRISDRLADHLLPLCLDASDVMPAAVRDAFYEAVLLTMAHPRGSVEARLNDVQRVQAAQPRRVLRLTGVCSRPR
ncbi:carbohydrate ABC transporter substrate-binding protein [Streptomyces sp. sk2.1]|uniref:carbohydrate ABC transporter substrate-binding protein n=1 Tax=Streptomyces sp. sk2.1 TaxID=2478959 RepID=UPI0011E7EEFC|nr:carbohydrate ABC transporter substrate-binding protein [Streptomyces sp. sk2.1]TXS60954.1 carbohydrate ABC transporter substrate-binding protein [Streptomyces sp. sk2.1]